MSYHRHSLLADAQHRHPHRRFNVVEAGEYTGISVSTLNKLRVFGGGCAYAKIGRHVVYEPADLDAWMDAKRRTSTSDAGAGM